MHHRETKDLPTTEPTEDPSYIHIQPTTQAKSFAVDTKIIMILLGRPDKPNSYFHVQKLWCVEMQRRLPWLIISTGFRKGSCLLYNYYAWSQKINQIFGPNLRFYRSSLLIPKYMPLKKETAQFEFEHKHFETFVLRDFWKNSKRKEKTA